MVPMLDQPPKAIKVPQVTDAHIKANFVDYVKVSILPELSKPDSLKRMFYLPSERCELIHTRGYLGLHRDNKALLWLSR